MSGDIQKEVDGHGIIEGILVASGILEEINSEYLFLYSSIQEILSVSLYKLPCLFKFYSSWLCFCKCVCFHKMEIETEREKKLI